MLKDAEDVILDLSNFSSYTWKQSRSRMRPGTFVNCKGNGSDGHVFPHNFVWGSCFCFCIPRLLLRRLPLRRLQPSFTHNFVTHHLSHTQLFHTPSFCVAGGDLATSTVVLRGRHGTYGTALGLVARGPLGRSWRRGTLCGRHGAWRHPLSGVALGDIYILFVWQAWHLWHWAGSGGTYGTALALVAWLGAAGRRWRRGTWRHPPSFCMAGVVLGDIYILFAWQGWLWWHLWHCAGTGGALGRRWSPVTAWHLATSTVVLHGKCGAWWHLHSLRVAGVALMALGWVWWRAWAPLVAGDAAALCVAGVARGDIHLRFAWGSGGALGRRWSLTAWHFAWQAWRLATSTLVLRSRCGTSGTGWIWWRAWSRLVARGTLRGRRGTWRHQLSVCVAGVALGDINVPLRGRRGAWWHPAASISLMHDLVTPTHNFVTHNLSHTSLSHAISLLHTSLSHTALSRTILSHTTSSQTTLSHTQLCHTQLFHTHTTLSHTTLSHTQLCHKQSFTHTQNFDTQNPFTHTALSHTIFHTQLCHKQLCHKQLCHTHNSFTYNLSHTTLSHTHNSSNTRFKNMDRPPGSVSCRFNHFFWLLEEIDFWG